MGETKFQLNDVSLTIQCEVERRLVGLRDRLVLLEGGRYVLRRLADRMDEIERKAQEFESQVNERLDDMCEEDVDASSAVSERFVEQAHDERGRMLADIRALRAKVKVLDMHADTVDRSVDQVATRCHQHRINARGIHYGLEDLRSLGGRIVQHLEERSAASLPSKRPSSKTLEAENTVGHSDSISGASALKQEDAKTAKTEERATAAAAARLRSVWHFRPSVSGLCDPSLRNLERLARHAYGSRYHARLVERTG